MKKLISIVSSGALIAMLMTGAAQAQYDYGVDVNGGGGTSGSVGGSGAGASVDTGVDVDANAGADTTASDQDANATGSAQTNVSVTSGAAISITQEEAASASIDAESAELSAEAVATAEDLNLYATSRLKRDANLESVVASSEEVSLTYRHDARFLGFIPASITARATARSDGTVDIDYPWYRFLFAVDAGANLAADLEAGVREVLAANADASAGLTLAQEAELIERMHTALAGEAYVETDASAAAGGTVLEGSGANVDAADNPIEGGASGGASQQ